MFSSVMKSKTEMRKLHKHFELSHFSTLTYIDEIGCNVICTHCKFRKRRNSIGPFLVYYRELLKNMKLHARYQYHLTFSIK